MRTILALVVVVWLLIGLAAAFQRDYFSGAETNCAEVGNIALTIVGRTAQLHRGQPRGGL